MPSKSVSLRSVTCHQPVIPGLTARRCRSNSVYSATSLGRGGRGPTTDIWPGEHVDELRELVDGVLANELADPGDARVVLHLEHGAGDLVLPLELSEALVSVFIHAAELPHAEGGQAAVVVGLAHAHLAVEQVALALRADGRGQHRAGNGDDGKHAAAEHDVECALHGAVARARAAPVLHGLHGLVAHARIAAAHGTGNKRGPYRRVLPCHFFGSQVQIHVPVPKGPPIYEFKLRMNYQRNVPLRLTGYVQRKQLPKSGVAFAHVYRAPALMTVDLFSPGLLSHQRALLNVKNAVFNPLRRCCAPRHRRRARCDTSPAHRPAWAHRPAPCCRQCGGKAQMG